MVTYDVLPSDERLARFEALGDAPLVLPNSWTPKQRYYLYHLRSDSDSDHAPAPRGPSNVFDAGAIDAGLRAVLDAHQSKRHPDADTPDDDAPELENTAFLATLATTLGTNAVASFLRPREPPRARVGPRGARTSGVHESL